MLYELLSKFVTKFVRRKPSLFLPLFVLPLILSPLFLLFLSASFLSSLLFLFFAWSLSCSLIFLFFYCVCKILLLSMILQHGIGLVLDVQLRQKYFRLYLSLVFFTEVGETFCLCICLCLFKGYLQGESSSCILFLALLVSDFLSAGSQTLERHWDILLILLEYTSFRLCRVCQICSRFCFSMVPLVWSVIFVSYWLFFMSVHSLGQLSIFDLSLEGFVFLFHLSITGKLVSPWRTPGKLWEVSFHYHFDLFFLINELGFSLFCLCSQ